MKLLLFVSATLFSVFGYANLDQLLKERIRIFGFESVQKPKGFDKRVYELGANLFVEKNISGNRNISCSTCHSERFGSGDGLPLAIGQGGVGEGVYRKMQKGSGFTPRHSPNLFNIGHSSLEIMFWDGRVARDSETGELYTPDPSLNGPSPRLAVVVETIDSALAAQALFPMVSELEMRGYPGQNEIANAKTRPEAWHLIVERLVQMEKYQVLFRKAFPGERVHIGHVAKALAHFQRHRFAVYNTPWDRYLNGDLKALSALEKQGALVFSGQARCANCHNGALLGGSSFFNVVSPQLGNGFDIHKNDEGLFQTTKRNHDRYKFKTPMLRNLRYTAPYFHSGAYATIDQVIEHYVVGANAIDNYDSRWLQYFEKNNYFTKVFVETDPYRNFRKKETAHPLMRAKTLRLSKQEKAALKAFLLKSLSQ